MSARCARMTFMTHPRTWTDEQLRVAVLNVSSFAAVARVLGLAPTGGSIVAIKRRIAALGLDVSHFKGRSWRRVGQPAPGCKICNKCHTEKPLAEFYRRGKGYQAYCKHCQDEWLYDRCACGSRKAKKHRRCQSCRYADVALPRVDLSEADIAWVAGILEGEGCWTRKRNGSRWWIAVRMTDKDIIDRLAQVTGVGRISQDRPRRPHHKMAWAWLVMARPHREWLTVQVWPRMGERRARRIEEVWPEVRAVVAQQAGHQSSKLA
jgi:hypothetical protein